MSNSNPLSGTLTLKGLALSLMLVLGVAFIVVSVMYLTGTKIEPPKTAAESGTQVKPVPIEKHFKIIYQETIDSTTYTEFISPNGFFCVSVYGTGLHCYRNRVETGE